MNSEGMMLTYILPVIGTLVIVGAYLLFTRKRKGGDSPTKTKPESPAVGPLGTEEAPGAVEVRVYDIKTRLAYNVMLPGDAIAKIKESPDGLGRNRLRKGKWIFAFFKTDADNYKPVIPPVTLDCPPGKVHRALNPGGIEIVFDVQSEKGLLQKYLPVLIWSGIIIFIMWMAVAD